MKNLKIIAVIVVAMCTTYCTKETEDAVPQDQSQQQEMSAEILSKLERMGFDTKKIPVIKREDGYTVEGDIFISKKELATMGDSKQRYRSLVTCNNVRRITLRNDLPRNSLVRRTVVTAVNNWNNVNGSFLNIRIVNRGGDIVVGPDNGRLGASIIGEAEFPRGGRPGSRIFINTDTIIFRTGNPPTFDEWRSTVEHEIGHAIGIAHTNNVFELLIQGTAVVDNNSLMNGGRAGTVRNLTVNDRLALIALYGRTDATSLCN